MTEVLYFVAYGVLGAGALLGLAVAIGVADEVISDDQD
jgi:hypothetical protein